MRGYTEVKHCAYARRGDLFLTYCGDLIPSTQMVATLRGVPLCTACVDRLFTRKKVNPITRVDPKWLRLECLNPDRLPASKALAVEED